VGQVGVVVGWWFGLPLEPVHDMAEHHHQLVLRPPVQSDPRPFEAELRGMGAGPLAAWPAQGVAPRVGGSTPGTPTPGTPTPGGAAAGVPGAEATDRSPDSVGRRSPTDPRQSGASACC
jgi:hypothetical protein